MKIIKAPKFEETTCHSCGTVFLPEPGDYLEFITDNIVRDGNIIKIYTFCPKCHSYIKVYDANKEEVGNEM